MSSCSETSGILTPVVNLNNCGGKEDCIPACPYNVLEMTTISEEDKLKGKLKTFFKPKKAYITNANLCYACGLCVKACPERAIKLIHLNKLL